MLSATGVNAERLNRQFAEGVNGVRGNIHEMVDFPNH